MYRLPVGAACCDEVVAEFVDHRHDGGFILFHTTHQPQAMDVNDVESNTFKALVLSFGWLSVRELCSVSTLNSEFLAATREDYI